MKYTMKTMLLLVILLAIGLLAAAAFVHFGIFNIAADEPHSKAVHHLVETVRERSIVMRSPDIEVPPLNKAELIISGATEYNEMCTGCHLRPGLENTELREGLYPQPPNLSMVKRDDPRETFWIIKHGLKMTGMPAWGKTHDDGRIWAMVAFLQQLPRLTPAQYEALADPGESEHEHDGMRSVHDKEGEAAAAGGSGDHHH